jgi:hypothetical protein
MSIPVLFDTVIYGFLIVDAIFILFLLANLKGRGFSLPGFILLIVAGFAWVTVFYGSFIEPRSIVVNQNTVELTKNPKVSMRAAVISDFHVGPYKKADFIEKIVTQTLELKPDIVLLGGDFGFGSTIDELQYLEPLKNLKAPLGVFAVLGNHDYGYSDPLPSGAKNDETRAAAVTDALKKLGIKVLINESEFITKNGRTIYLIGVDELFTNRAEIPFQVAPHPSVILSHNPDIIAKASDIGIDLVIAGHTHGGQIRLPFIGPVPTIPTELGRNFTHGLYNFGKNTQMYITNGIGEWGTRARLFNKPEIAILNLKI